MIGDLPDLDDFFEGPSAEDIEHELSTIGNKSLRVLLSKENSKWIPVNFLSIAAGHVGMHVELPVNLELTSEELKNVKIKFVKKSHNKDITILEIPVLIRWQESDNVTGNLKLGLHFHGETKYNETLNELLKKLSAKENKITDE